MGNNPIPPAPLFISQEDEIARLRQAYAVGSLTLEQLSVAVEQTLRSEPLPDPSHYETR